MRLDGVDAVHRHDDTTGVEDLALAMRELRASESIAWRFLLPWGSELGVAAATGHSHRPRELADPSPQRGLWEPCVAERQSGRAGGEPVFSHCHDGH
jgi:hypothetical protein